MSILKHGLIAALGIFFIIIGVVVPHIINWKVRDAIRDALTLEGPHDSGYENWVVGKSASSIRKCVPMHLTNPAEFLAGAKPNIQMRTQDEVWFSQSKNVISANWTADRRSVRFANFVQYQVHPNSPGDPDKPFLTLNHVYLYMVSQAGSETNLKVGLAAGMMGKMVQAGGVTAFRSNATFCLTGGICGIAAYAAATSNTAPTFTDTTAGMMVGMLAPYPAVYGGYMLNVSTIAAMPAGAAKTAMISYMDSRYPFFTSHDPSVSMDSVFLVQYLNWLQTATFNTLVGGFSSAPAYGLKFQNTTCRKIFFQYDKLANFLTGSTASVLTNMTSHSEANVNTLMTGFRDDSLLGMDYFTEVQGVTTVTSQSVTPYSVAGRQTSYTPFTSRPDRVSIFFSAFMRFIDLVYSGASKTIYGIPTNEFVVDKSTTEVSTEFYNPFAGFLNMSGVAGGLPIFFSMPRFNGANQSEFPSLIDGLGAPTGHEKAALYFEPTTGQAISAAAPLQLNIYARFSKGLFATADLNHTQDMMWPIVAGEDRKEITESAASSLKLAVVTAPLIEVIIFYVFVIIGCLLVIGAVGWWIYLAYCSGASSGSVDGGAAGGGDFHVGASANGDVQTTKQHGSASADMPVEMQIKHEQSNEVVAANPLFGGVRVTAGEDA